jgi:hypothetical protein
VQSSKTHLCCQHTLRPITVNSKSYRITQNLDLAHIFGVGLTSLYQNYIPLEWLPDEQNRILRHVTQSSGTRYVRDEGKATKNSQLMYKMSIQFNGTAYAEVEIGKEGDEIPKLSE